MAVDSLSVPLEFLPDCENCVQDFEMSESCIYKVDYQKFPLPDHRWMTIHRKRFVN